MGLSNENVLYLMKDLETGKILRFFFSRNVLRISSLLRFLLTE